MMFLMFGCQCWTLMKNLWCLYFWQNPSVPVNKSDYTIGGGGESNFSFNDPSLSGILCSIKHSQVLL